MKNITSNIYNHEAEMSIIGRCISNEASIKIAISNICPYHFYSSGNKIIYDTMLTMVRNNKPVDLVTLSNELRISKNLEKIGGHTKLLSCIDIPAIDSNILEYIRIVRRCYIESNICRNIINVFENKYNLMEIENLLRTSLNHIEKQKEWEKSICI